MNIGYATEFPGTIGFDKVEQTVRDTLKDHGFGILTEIDVKATLKKKIDVDRADYKILGACNPPKANQALNGEPDIGLMLPCNVIIYKTEKGTIRFATTKASTMFTLVDNPEIEPVAEEVDEIMQKVIKQVEAELL